ncbi:hypothetical protein EFY87_03470 [Flexivirga caeni]|uniref:Nucleotidyl transferase AbiEii/AbiGii toxin family protein n=2 Tax=Flexivirga caeni TaxID=2294115 RepID=A0A3M9MIV1_9MICO|nr:hypothetical protein EFY87_03470 [Flexivirga caeni]
MLVGSAATAIRPVPLRPADVDILLHPESTATDLTAVAEVLVTVASPSAGHTSLADFTSSIDVPWAEAGDWTFGRWRVDGVALELARIRSEVSPLRLVETIGHAVWTTTEIVRWHEMNVPVVPLEVQLATNRSRGLSDRANAIERHFARSRAPEAALLKRAFLGADS